MTTITIRIGLRFLWYGDKYEVIRALGENDWEIIKTDGSYTRQIITTAELKKALSKVASYE